MFYSLTPAIAEFIVIELSFMEVLKNNVNRT